MNSPLGFTFSFTFSAAATATWSFRLFRWLFAFLLEGASTRLILNLRSRLLALDLRSQLLSLDLRPWLFSLNLWPWSFLWLRRIAYAYSLSSRNIPALKLLLYALLFPLLLFKLADLPARFIIAATCFARQLIDLLPAIVDLRYASVALVFDLELLVPRLLCDALNA